VKVKSSLADISLTDYMKDVLEQMDLLEAVPEGWRIKNVAAMMFSERPDRFFKQAQIEELEANGSPAAMIETDEGRTYFLIDIPCHPYFVNKEIAIDSGGVKEGNVTKDGVKDGVKELTEIQKVIIKEMLSDSYITTSEMAQKTGIKFRTLQRYISQLQSMGVVVRKDGRKDGHWEVLISIA